MIIVYVIAAITGLVIWLCGALVGWTARGALAARYQWRNEPLLLRDAQATELVTVPARSVKA